MKKELLFVYGTLRRGEALHAHLHGMKFLDEKKIPGLRLIAAADKFPSAIFGESELSGELYEVDAKKLEELDEIEEVPKLYRRERVGKYWVYLRQPIKSRS